MTLSWALPLGLRVADAEMPMPQHGRAHGVIDRLDRGQDAAVDDMAAGLSIARRAGLVSVRSDEREMMGRLGLHIPFHRSTVWAGFSLIFPPPPYAAKCDSKTSLHFCLPVPVRGSTTNVAWLIFPPLQI